MEYVKVDSENDQRLWQAWADRLHSWGLGHLAAFFLETLGPFALLGAQAIYMAKPLLGEMWPVSQLDSAARLLEDGQLIQKFARMLREYPVP